MAVDWSPAQYRRFATERAQPFHDLIALVEPGSIRSAADLGCGPGELTAMAASRLAVDQMTGIDNSPSMLAAARHHERDGLAFVDGDISSWTSERDHDLVIAAASLQWIPDHAAVLQRWTDALRAGGQIAVQLPANAHMPAHTVARDVAGREPFRSAFGSQGPPVDPVGANVLEPEAYAQLLHETGFRRQHVRLVVYPHVLESSRDVVQWVKGTTLTRFERRLPAPVFAEFLAEYERALLDVIGDDGDPYFFPFRRILFWGRLP